jgi:ankyrin repeat protein
MINITPDATKPASLRAGNTPRTVVGLHDAISSSDWRRILNASLAPDTGTQAHPAATLFRVLHNGVYYGVSPAGVDHDDLHYPETLINPSILEMEIVLNEPNLPATAAVVAIVLHIFDEIAIRGFEPPSQFLSDLRRTFMQLTVEGPPLREFADIDYWSLCPQELLDKLERAAVSGTSNKILKLIRAGAPINAAVGEARPLHLAAYHNPAVAKTLIKLGADCNATDLNGYRLTPLHSATQDGARTDPNTLKALLNAGANPNARDAAGFTPLHNVIKYHQGNPKLINVLLEGGAHPQPNYDDRYPHAFDPLLTAAANNYRAAVALLLQAGGDINTKDHRGRDMVEILGANKGGS